MSEITVFYASTDITGIASEKLALPDTGKLKLSDLAKLIASRYPNTGIDRVLGGSRWSVDGRLIYDSCLQRRRGGNDPSLNWGMSWFHAARSVSNRV